MKMTEAEFEALGQYHLDLQIRAMDYKKQAPPIDFNKNYEVLVCVDRDTNKVGEFTKILTGKQLDFQLFMNEVLEIKRELEINDEKEKHD